MQLHEHEPNLTTLWSQAGAVPDPLDPDAYPLIAVCQGCGKFVKASSINAPYLASPEYAGAPDEAWPMPARYDTRETT